MTNSNQILKKVKVALLLILVQRRNPKQIDEVHKCKNPKKSLGSHSGVFYSDSNFLLLFRPFVTHDLRLCPERRKKKNKKVPAKPIARSFPICLKAWDVSRKEFLPLERSKYIIQSLPLKQTIPIMAGKPHRVLFFKPRKKNDRSALESHIRKKVLLLYPPFLSAVTSCVCKSENGGKRIMISIVIFSLTFSHFFLALQSGRTEYRWFFRCIKFSV